ncbi:LysR family transcriptional regulator [Paraburkholderia sp.]|uniref:LysR family transcriptional regulator n=1 Tax=Paraburkholderia sp. TaxID=1926495 RepID=UPI002D598B8E|nr:LysR family transcriptional regulator [Paraburkholderia sp.]HZZ02740.1 LysR family transcriptional regulator [Paraburkholderia sp.]
MLPSSLGVDLLELETFIAVAEAGSFSVAAERLCVTQPAVTGRVQRLETALGTALLRRTTRKVETTPQGARLLTESVRALRSLRGVIEEFRADARLARQRVVVAATPMLAAVVLPAIIHRYSARFPDVEVELRDLQYADALAALDSGRADLALLALASDDGRYHFEPVRSDGMVLIAPADHAFADRLHIDPAELAGQRLLVIDQYLPIMSGITEALKARGLEPPSCKAVGNLNTLLGMVDAGLGLTLLPRVMAHRSTQNGHRLIELDGLELRRTFGIVWPRDARLSASSSSFCRFLSEAMAG